ncbi:MAG: ribonuclease HII [Candidatus Omnitrophica bacterium CG11_big_fil_rev_8_21_14_0_20_64_10]|nr:MAG: ribonuclease HII [Candidatus Omnitrophica bacterium CG11_big_fil_rev_8_21_14_0_20_64_10]
MRHRHKLKLRELAGLDEAGRGPLAGPIVVSAVVLYNSRFTLPVNDSKKMTPSARVAACGAILRQAAVGIGVALPEEIDRLGIEAAWGLAMRRAAGRLSILPKLALVDGNRLPPGLPFPAQPLVQGDGRSLVIAAASVVAKVTRDRLMERLHRLVPEYRFERHKGYGTAEHLKLLKTIGPSPFHRYSFEPLR